MRQNGEEARRHIRPTKQGRAEQDKTGQVRIGHDRASKEADETAVEITRGWEWNGQASNHRFKLHISGTTRLLGDGMFSRMHSWGHEVAKEEEWMIIDFHFQFMIFFKIELGGQGMTRGEGGGGAKKDLASWTIAKMRKAMNGTTARERARESERERERE